MGLEGQAIGFGALLMILVTALLASMACNDLDARARRFALISFTAHIVCSFGQWFVMLFYYDGGGGDFAGYQAWGALLARLMGTDPVRYLPEIVKLGLHMEAALPFNITGEGTSTATMSAIAGVLMTFTGPTLINICLVAAFFSWFGQVCLYRVAREELPEADHLPALVGILLVPSVCFWGGGYTKESFVLGFFGILVRSASRALRHYRASSFFGIAVGGLGIAMLKPYTLFAFIVAVAAFIYAVRARRDATDFRFRPGSLLLAFTIAVGGLVAMGQVFPQFAAGNVAETVAVNQENWAAMHETGDAGGSAVDIGDGGARSLPAQVAFVPLAFINSFFRPALFEARGAPMLGAAVESTLLTIAVLSLLGAETRKMAMQAILHTPVLVFSVVFCVTFGVGVGLATPNLGTLSRYRAPMMPFYVTAVLILRERSRAAKQVAALRPARLVRPLRSPAARLEERPAGSASSGA